MCYFAPVYYNCGIYHCQYSFVGIFFRYLITQEFWCHGQCTPGIGNMLLPEFFGYPC